MEKFKRLEKLISKEAINSLNKKTVLVLGIGGVGGYTGITTRDLFVVMD